MQYEEVVVGKRSIGGYLPDPVPKSLIKEELEMAIRAPSSLNRQPWNFYVVSQRKSVEDAELFVGFED